MSGGGGGRGIPLSGVVSGGWVLEDEELILQRGKVNLGRGKVVSGRGKENLVGVKMVLEREKVGSRQQKLRKKGCGNDFHK